LEEAVPRVGRSLSPDDPNLIGARHNLAVAYLVTGRLADAEPLFRELADQARGLVGRSDKEMASALALLALCRIKLEKWVEAEPVLRECLTIRERIAPDAWSTFNIRSMLGGSLLGQSRFDEAEPLILEGYQALKARESTIPQPGRPRLSEAAARVVRLYEKWGRPEEAARWREALKTDLDLGFPADPFARP
jgi:tetratricopeptide (TPR) repeat protein